MKRMITVLITLVLVLTGCGATVQALPEGISKDPRAFTTTKGAVLHYGDSKETVEKVLGKKSKNNYEWLSKNYLKYPDNTYVLYRDQDNSLQAVLYLLQSPKYITYQGIRVGDKWDDVSDRLVQSAGEKNVHVIAFNGDQPVDPMSKDKADDWFMISYILDDNGSIESITLYDVMAGRDYK